MLQLTTLCTGISLRATLFERVEPGVRRLPPLMYNAHGGRVMKVYTAIVEKCADTGLYVGHVPGFPGAHTQAETLDELNANLHEVIEMLLEDGEPQMEADFIGTQTVMVA